MFTNVPNIVRYIIRNKKSCMIKYYYKNVDILINSRRNYDFRGLKTVDLCIKRNKIGRFMH